MQHNQTNITKPTYNFSLCSKVTATFSVMEQVTEQLQNEQQVTWDFPLEGPVFGLNHPGINWRWGQMFIIIPNKRPNVSKSLCQKYSWFEMFSSWSLWYFVFQCVFLVVVVTLFSLQLSAVHLVDSHYCSDPAKFISVLLTSLSTMIQVELPHVNVLSKIDLIENYGKLGKI